LGDAIALPPVGGHFASPVHTLGRADGRPQSVGEHRIGDDPIRRWSSSPVAVRAWGDLHTVLGEDSADRLDPKSTGPQMVDEAADQR